MREVRQVEQTRAGQDMLDLGPSVAIAQEPRELQLPVRSRGEVRVPAFAGDGEVAVADWVEQRLAEAGTCRDQRDGPFRLWLARLERFQFVWQQDRQAVRHRLEIVEQLDAGQVEHA